MSICCPSCSTELNSDNRPCAKCGYISTPVPLENQTSVEKNHPNLALTLAWVTVLIWTGLLIFPHESFSAESVGEWFGTMLLPFVIAYLASRGWKQANKTKFAGWLLALGVLLPAASHPKRLTALPKKDMYRQLAGVDAVDSSLDATDKENVEVARGIFDRLRTVRAEYDTDNKKLLNDLESLYSATSFISEETRRKCLTAVDAKLALDSHLIQIFDSMPDLVDSELAKSPLNVGQRSRFKEGFMKSFSSSATLPAYHRMIDAEEKWTTSVHELYEFSGAHERELSARGDTVVIGNNATRDEFNRLTARSTDMHDQFVAASDEVDRLKAEHLKKEGITERDLGLLK